MLFHHTKKMKELGYLEFLNNDDKVIEVNKCLVLEYYQSKMAIIRHSILKIGRNTKGCSLIINDPAISSSHCTIWGILFDDESVPMCYVKDTSLNGTVVNGKLLEKDVAYLLQDNDIIDFWPNGYANNTKTSNSDNFPFNNHNIMSEKYPSLRFKSLIKTSLTSTKLPGLNFENNIDNWQITSRCIGNGTFGHVMVCYQSRKTPILKLNASKLQLKLQSYAVKIIKLKPNKIDKEAKILLNLDHPNIIKVYHTHIDASNNLYIFQDLIAGGDLFSYLAKGDCLTSISETESILIVYQILNALNYLHSHGIVHRDLKLDNILLSSPTPCTKIILADFGIAKHLTSNTSRMHTVVGTPEYCAPEVGFKANRKFYSEFSRAATLTQQQSGYDKKCDLWSLGVITHIMLTGISPFYGDGSEKSIIQNATEGNLNFNIKHWSKLVKELKILLGIFYRLM